MRNNYRNLKLSSRLPKRKNKKIFLLFIILIIVGVVYFVDLDTKVKYSFVRIKNYNFVDKFSNLCETFKYRLRSDENELDFEFYNSSRKSIIEIYFLNLLSTRNFNLADKLKAHVILLGLPAEIKVFKGNYSVVSGPYFSLKTVNHAKKRLVNHKIKSILIVKKVKNDKNYNLLK